MARPIPQDLFMFFKLLAFGSTYLRFFKLLARLIPQDLFMFFSKILARLIPQDLLLFFQTFGPTYSTRLFHVFSNFWPDSFRKTYSYFFKRLARLIPQDLIMFFQTFGPTYSPFIKKDQFNVISLCKESNLGKTEHGMNAAI